MPLLFLLLQKQLVVTYAEAIDYLFTRLPQFSRIGAAAYKKDLTNTIALCDAIGNPQKRFRSIHVAGTNGKGSVSHMLAAILQQAGYKTGLYTSPHLKDFRERIRVNGAMVTEDFVTRFTEKTTTLTESIEPSFFELTVAMAFEYFADEQVDIAVIETGLGGRLDSTNIIVPELSVITNIGMDHMNLLGDTLEKIAFEKAGIIKPHVPVVIGEYHPVSFPVFERVASERQSPLSVASQTQTVLSREWKNHQLQVTVTRDPDQPPVAYTLDLPGIYQSANLLTVLEACRQLQQLGWLLPQETVHTALQQVKKLTGLHGRWELLRQSPMVIADVAHNEDGIQQLIRQLALTPHEKLHIIFGAVKDKDIQAVLRLFPAQAHYYFTRAHIPRAIPEDELLQLATAQGLTGKAYSSVNTALYAASLKAGKKDLILVCGSVFVVGELSRESLQAIWGKEDYSMAEWNALEIAAWAFFR